MNAGDRLGSYVILSCIGSGAAGFVYKARHVDTGSVVAIKLITLARVPDKSLPLLRALLARLAQEANCLRRLRRYRVGFPRVIACEIAETYGYIVMELLSGESLAQLIEREAPLSRYRSLKIAISVATAIDAANTLGIFHRDIKPGNIFISESGDVHVLDLGLAKMRSGSRRLRRRVVTPLGAFIATPAYSSSHQARFSSDVDGSDEAWSIAAVLYEMLTGIRVRPEPFRLEDMLEGKMPPRNGISLRLWRVVSRALSVDRSTQYSSVSALRADLVFLYCVELRRLCFCVILLLLLALLVAFTMGRSLHL